MFDIFEGKSPLAGRSSTVIAISIENAEKHLHKLLATWVKKYRLATPC